MPAPSTVKSLLLSLLLSLGLFACAPQTAATNEPAETPAPQINIVLDPAQLHDTLILSLEENGFAHLFAYIPGKLSYTRLTSGDWSDITPSLSPDGKRLAFASNRSGFWDIYILDLTNGETRQVTNTPEYDSAPTWSPDSAWIAYESYQNDNLEIIVHSLNDSSQADIPLTEDPAADYSPVWLPNGRQIVFVSTRSGNADLWLANLDVTDATRFKNLSNTADAEESHPAISPDGKYVAWATLYQTVGYSGVYILDMTDPTRPPRWAGDGNWPAWNAKGDQIAAIVNGPNKQYLTSYSIDGKLLLSPDPLPGYTRGLLWSDITLPEPLPRDFQQSMIFTPVPLWAPAVTPESSVPNQRWYVVDIPDVQAPYPQLHDLVDESFAALRQRVIHDAGWDALASLQNAFVPLSISLDPGYSEDWLYTGRAFAINPLLTNAGWMITVREDIGSQTYWRLYVRAFKQDGSQGEPIHNPPWDLNARYELDPRVYEQGGKYAPVPAGYWVDLTALAAVYGWERQPALPNWRTYYGGTRFTEFALTNGLNWYSAMLELYPADALVTPTRVLAPTATPSKTPIPTSTRRPTRTPGPSPTASNTFTPLPPTATFTPPPPTSTPPTIIP
jgi:TolB protein